MKPFVRRHEVPLYCQTVYFVFADSLDDAVNALPPSCDGVFSSDELLGARNAAITKGSYSNGAVIIMFIRRYVSTHIVAHEALHAARLLLFSVGVGPMDENNEEAYAYLLSLLVSRIAEAQKKDAELLKQSEGASV